MYTKTAAALEIEAPDETGMERRWRPKEDARKFGWLVDSVLVQRALGGGE